MYRCRCSSSIVVVEEVTDMEIMVKIKNHDLHIGDFFRHYRNIVWGDGTSGQLLFIFFVLSSSDL